MTPEDVKKFELVFDLFVPVLVTLTIYGTSYAYRPFGTEDAGVAGKETLQLEMSWDYLEWNDRREHVFLLVPIYGVIELLELSVEIPFILHELQNGELHTGIGDMNLVAKYLVIKEGNVHPALALKGVVKPGNGDYVKGLGSGDEDYSIFAVASKTFGPLTTHSQVGYTWVGADKDENLRDIYLLGLGIDCGMTESFHAVGEINGNRHPDRTEKEDPRSILFGITYKLAEKLILDAALKRGLTASVPDWSATAGFSVTF